MEQLSNLSPSEWGSVLALTGIAVLAVAAIMAVAEVMMREVWK